MSSTPDRDVERVIDNGDAPLDATSGEQVCHGNSSSARTGSEAVWEVETSEVSESRQLGPQFLAHSQL